MAEDQPIIPTIVEKTLEQTLDSSVPSETPLTIPSSTIIENDTPKPDSHSPSITLITLSDNILSPSVENSEIPKIDSFSFLSLEILKERSKDGEQSETRLEERVFEVSADQSTDTPVSDFVAPMESQETEAIENVLAISAEGIVYEVTSAMPESQGEETQPLVGEGTMVLFEQPVLEETTGTPLEGPDPSLEEIGQGSSSQ
ncbi:hypothetical protein A4A49_60246, partial [Nicotiana attenuata]